MDDLITASYRLTEPDYVEFCIANYAYLCRVSLILRFARFFFRMLVVLLAIGLFLSWDWSAMETTRQLTILAVFGLLAWGVDFLFNPRTLVNRLWYRRHFRLIPEGSLSIEWGFNRESLWSRTALAEATYRWELFPTVVETPRCFLFLYDQRRLALWLPDHAFSSPGMLRTFTDLARSSVRQYVVLAPCLFPAKPEPIGLSEL